MSHDRGSFKFLCLPQLPLLVGRGGRINPQAVSQSTIDCRNNMFSNGCLTILRRLEVRGVYLGHLVQVKP